MIYFMQALLVGAVISIGAFEIANFVALRRTIAYNWRRGFLIGVGSSISDFIYAFICLISIKAITDFITPHLQVIEIIGAFLLIITGWIFAKKDIPVHEESTTKGAFGDVGLGFALNIFSPGNILAYGIGFNIMSMPVESISTKLALTIALGAMIGAILMWGLKVFLFAVLKRKLTEKRIKQVNKCLCYFMVFSGICLFIYALTGH